MNPARKPVPGKRVPPRPPAKPKDAGGVELETPSSSGREKSPPPASSDDEEEAAPPARATPPPRKKEQTGSRRPVKEQTGSAKALRGPSSASRRGRALEESDDDGTADAGSGLPLWLKIAVFTAILVAGAMFGLGHNLRKIAVAEIDRQIDQKGVAITNAIAETVDRLCFAKVERESEESALRDQAIDRWKRKLEQYVAKASEGLFLNILFTNEAGGEKVTLVESEKGGTRLTAVAALGDRYTASPKGDLGGVQVYEGQYESERFTGRFRKYVQRIAGSEIDRPRTEEDPPPRRGRRGARAGGGGPDEKLWANDAYVHVFLKADEIDRVQNEVQHRLMVATGIGVAIAVLLAVFVAAWLAAPLRALVNDIRCVAEGDLDHRTVVRSSDEIGLVAAQFNEMTRALREAQQLEQERQAIEHELTIATEIQTKLLPERIPQIPGFDVFSFYLSAKEVGGDYYDFLVVDPTHLGIVVADVSGKGVPGAMVMTMVRSLLRLASHRETSPAETLKKVNRILAKDIRRGMFVTAMYAVLDVQRKTLTVSSAGHNPMLLFEAKTGKARQVQPAGIALGFDKGRTFDENIKEETIRLEPGDRCVFYTDGVVEAMSERQEEFGLERFSEITAEHAALSSKDFTGEVVEALEVHRGRSAQSDDITITTLKVE